MDDESLVFWFIFIFLVVMLILREVLRGIFDTAMVQGVVLTSVLVYGRCASKSKNEPPFGVRHYFSAVSEDPRDDNDNETTIARDVSLVMVIAVPWAMTWLHNRY